ncbi:glutamine synthetase family protein [Streptomyces sp. NPDC059994]|uniref:glutamine synthetase family protein n=1 Tax=Streptomyces sp. NPDC059994 TaxID=3347029 RepID=UPI0036B7DF72
MTTTDQPQAVNRERGHVPAQGARLTSSDLARRVEAGDVEWVLLLTPDLQGRLQGKTHDAVQFLGAFDGEWRMCSYSLACDVDMQPLRTGVFDETYPDLLLQPDTDTIRLLPWRPRTALVLADALTPDGQAIAFAPRQLLRDQLDGLESTHHLQVAVGLEAEFVLYQASEDGNPMAPAWDGDRDYGLASPHTDLYYIQSLQHRLKQAGLPTQAVKLESAPGQVEVTFPHDTALRACDGHTILKVAAREVAAPFQLVPSWMAAPQTGVGSGLHLHLSLTDDTGSRMTNPDGSPSAILRHAVAGLLELMPHLAPLYAPNTNSYRRYSSAFAPSTYTWGHDNRTCAVRVTGSGASLRLEVRLAGADANPYCATAAAVAAIRHGLDHQLEPPPPCRTDAATLSIAQAPPVPADLDQAATAFQSSTALAKLLPPEAVQQYAALARQEAAWARPQVPDTERERWLTRA